MSIYCSLSCFKIWKKSLAWILRYKFAWFLVKIGPKSSIWPKRWIFWEISPKSFLSTYGALSYCKVWKEKKTLTEDSQIYAFIILGHNQVKIAHLAQRRILWGISHKWFLSTHCALSHCKVWKNALSRSWDTGFHNFGPISEENCPFCLKENFFWNFG